MSFVHKVSRLTIQSTFFFSAFFLFLVYFCNNTYEPQAQVYNDTVTVSWNTMIFFVSFFRSPCVLIR